MFLPLPSAKLIHVWFEFFPSNLSRTKGTSKTFLSLGLRPQLQKPFPWFPFFYLGFKNLSLAALYFTLDNLGKIKLHLKHFSWELPEQLFQQNTIVYTLWQMLRKMGQYFYQIFVRANIFLLLVITVNFFNLFCTLYMYQITYR